MFYLLLLSRFLFFYFFFFFFNDTATTEIYTLSLHDALPIPCAELIPLCQARCCTLSFALSTEDLDEGVIRWDYGQPYLIRQRSSDGYCVHNAPGSHACTVHAFRPRVCRGYDCRKDTRVWIDYEQRIPAPMIEGVYHDKGSGDAFN